MPTLIAQQLTLIALSLSIFVTVRRYGRRGELSFALTIMWWGIATLGVIASILLPNIDVVGASFGVVPAALFAGMASTILGIIALVLSLRVSQMEERQRDLAESLGRWTISFQDIRPKDSSATLAIVPAFNEAASIGAVVRGLLQAGIPVLVVNDGSTDQTASVAVAEGATVLTLPINLGVGGALRAGFRVAREAGFSQVVQCDADGQHPVRSVQHLIAAQAEHQVDLLIGSRFVDSAMRRREGVVRFLATLVLAKIASQAASFRISDATSGLRIIRSPLLDELARSMPAHYLGDTFEVNVMAGRAGYLLGEVPVAMMPRQHGSSSASTFDAVRLTLRAVLVALPGLPNKRLRKRVPTGS